MRHDDSLATILLVSRHPGKGNGDGTGEGDGPTPLKAAEFWKLCALTGRPGALLGQPQDDLVRRYGLASELAGRIAALLDRATALAFEMERLDQSGIWTLTPFDEHYPPRFIPRLGSRAPPLLHGAGAPELLDQVGIGVVGSRDVSDDGAEVAKGTAERAARLGRSVVSGGARGVDQLAMTAAQEAGGTVIGIVAEALRRALVHPDVRRAVHRGTTVMCTPYGPDAPFSAGNARGRNKLVYAQSALTVVVASGADKGGTWSGAVEALRGNFGRVAVWHGQGEGTGNQRLQDMGATPMTSFEVLDDLLGAPEPKPAVGQAPVAQPSLFDEPGAG